MQLNTTNEYATSARPPASRLLTPATRLLGFVGPLMRGYARYIRGGLTLCKLKSASGIPQVCILDAPDTYSVAFLQSLPKFEAGIVLLLW